ncbi:hypothetical protein BGW39_000482 [Mortierella sp. 14UC]|nr:hypothetical protein BGW39_000482 [Mortierella sp. 14UC]
MNRNNQHYLALTDVYFAVMKHLNPSTVKTFYGSYYNKEARRYAPSSKNFRSSRSSPTGPTPNLGGGHTAISSDDAIAAIPWVSAEYRQLDLTIMTDAWKPFYKRVAPVVLTVAEPQVFTQLELFYRQLGSLREIRIFRLENAGRSPSPILAAAHLRHWSHGPLRHACHAQSQESFSQDTRMPGYLQYLEKCRKVEELSGAFLLGRQGHDQNRWSSRAGVDGGTLVKPEVR